MKILELLVIGSANIKNLRQLITLALLILSCESPMDIDIQGHRGARGLLPENTVPAFRKALDYGVTTLELDVVITRDQKVLVSHEPWVSAEICLDPEGNEIREGSARSFNIYRMDLIEIQRCDCGLKEHPRFPDQEKLAVSKPLLSEVIMMAESYSKERGRKAPNYNIEIKSSSPGDNIYHPNPPDFCELVIGQILTQLSTDRFNIQSFDFRVLRYVHEKYPEIQLAVLIENDKKPEENLADLGFNPAIYSGYYEKLDRDEIKKLHALGLKVIPWTVNNPDDMEELISWGVDGIITDYPDRAQRFIKE